KPDAIRDMTPPMGVNTGTTRNIMVGFYRSRELGTWEKLPGEIDTRKYRGIAFRHNGRGMDGVDCLGLILVILRDAGIILPDDDGRPITPRWYDTDPQRLVRGLERYGRRIDVTELQPLDVVVFSFHGKPRHAG